MFSCYHVPNFYAGTLCAELIYGQHSLVPGDVIQKAKEWSCRPWSDARIAAMQCRE